MVWRIEKGEKMEWNGMRRMVFPNGGIFFIYLPGVDSKILDPRDTYADASQWEEKAKDLAGRFIKNFAKYEYNEAGKALVPAGPQL